MEQILTLVHLAYQLMSDDKEYLNSLHYYYQLE